MTTPFKAKSLTTTPKAVVPAVSTPAPPPPPIIPPTPAPPKGPNAARRFINWQNVNRHLHPFTWWCALIAICIISFRILWAAMVAWPAFRGYVIFGGFFWFTCIGMTPILAIYRTGINITKEILGHD